jgi:6-phosphofructokinase 2
LYEERHAVATIVTVTINPAIDASCSIERVAPERKLHCSEPRWDAGGGGVNVARAIRHLGGNATAFWTCGGVMGQLLGRLLDAEGVEHHPVPIEAMTRENFIVFETSTTQQYRFGMPGPLLRSAETQQFLARVRDFKPTPDYLVLSGSLPPGAPDDLYAHLAQQRPSNCRVILDASGNALRSGIAAGVYLIKPNMRELGQLAGRAIEKDTDVEEISRRLIQEGKVEVVVTSLGAGGAVLVTAEGAERLRAPTVKIRSKVGAGDSTVAGIVLSLARGNSLSDSVRFGIAAGAATVMTDGTSLCRKEDVERLYEEMVR